MLFLFKKDEQGVAQIEYGLVSALISCVAIISTASFGSSLSSAYCSFSEKIGIVMNSFNSGLIKCAIIETYGEGTTMRHNSAGGESCGDFCLTSHATSLDANLLYAMNKVSPITNYYGLYDSSGHTITSLDAAMQAINISNSNANDVNDGNGEEGLTLADGSTYDFEVKNQNGDSYGVFYAYGQMAYRNLATGETYGLNPTTNQITDYGITSGNKWNKKL